MGSASPHRGAAQQRDDGNRRHCSGCGALVAADNNAHLCSRCLREQRDQLRAPPAQLKSEFFESDEFRAAFEIQHIGRVFKAYRNSPRFLRLLGRALNQETLGRWLGLTQAQVSKIENGKPEQNLAVLRSYAQVLCLPQHLLWFDLPGQSRYTLPPTIITSRELSEPLTRREEPDWPPDAVEAAPLVQRVTRRDLLLNRRELGCLFSTVPVLMGGTLLDRLERWLASPASSETDGNPTARTASIGYEEMIELENAAQAFRNWDDQFGGGLRRKAVIGQLNEVSDLLLRESHPANIRRRLHVVMAELSETAATMSWDIGQQAVAQRYYLLALHAARTADDPAFATNVLAGMARQLLYLDRPSDALELVRLAQAESAGRLTLAAQSMLRTREAWALAASGRVAGFERATATAEDALTEVSYADEPHWIQYFDSAELYGTTGGRLLELAYKDASYATAAGEKIRAAIDARRPGRLRSSALDEIGLAEVSMLLGDFSEAARIGDAALDVVERTSSDRVRVQMRNLQALVDRNPGTRAIADLRERMGTVLLTPSRGA